MFLCVLCRSSETNEVMCGELLDDELQLHTFCLYLTPNLCQASDEDVGLFGFLLDDIRKEVRRISRLNCCYCSKSYANIGCCNTKCRRTFHLICGIKNGAENQFVGTYNSYCDLHVRKKKCRVPKHDEKCSICYEHLRAPRQRFNALNILCAPCCKNGWFHKMCLQKFAQTAGYFFKCPLCNDKKIFCEKLPYRGIFIYDRDAAWELEPNAFVDQLERPNSCAAKNCQYMAGRDKTTQRNPLLLCTGCGSIAMHKYCLPASIRGNNFYCSVCSIGQERKCENLRLNKTNESDNEDYDVDVCNDSDENDDESSSNEEIIIRCKGVQSINKIYDDDDDDCTKCSSSQCIPKQNTEIIKFTEADSDVENECKVQPINLTDNNDHKNEPDNNNIKEYIDDCYDKAQNSSSFFAGLQIKTRKNSLESTHDADNINSDEQPKNNTISRQDENDDCISIYTISSTVSNRSKSFDESCCAANDSSLSSDHFPNFEPLNADKEYDKEHLSSIRDFCNTSSMNTSCIANCIRLKTIYINSDTEKIALPLSSSKSDTSVITQKSSQYITNDVGHCNSSSMNTSCIANRTRRKSIYAKTSVNSYSPGSGHVHSIEPTCISQRTRRKSMCHQRQLRNEASEGYATNLTSPNVIQQESCANKANINAEKSNLFAHDSQHNEIKPLNATSIANRLRKRKLITQTTVDVKDYYQIQASTSSFDISSDTQFESLNSISTKSSYKSIKSSETENEASTSEQSNSSLKKSRVKVLVKRVRNFSASRKLTSSKYRRLLSTDDENYLNSKPTASETRLQRNFRLENAKCPMRAKHNNIMPYLRTSYKCIDRSLKTDKPCNVIELYD